MSGKRKQHKYALIKLLLGIKLLATNKTDLLVTGLKQRNLSLFDAVYLVVHLYSHLLLNLFQEICLFIVITGILQRILLALKFPKITLV